MRGELLKAYEWYKRLRVELCEEDADELKKRPDMSELRHAINRTERRKNELLGMIQLMKTAGAITEKESEEKEKEIKELFSSKKLFGAKIKVTDGQLKIYASEIKKED